MNNHLLKNALLVLSLPEGGMIIACLLGVLLASVTLLVKLLRFSRQMLLVVREHIRVPPRFLRRPPSAARVLSAAEESRYWSRTAGDRTFLLPSNDRQPSALVHYYSPRLLPPYRVRHRAGADVEAEPFRVPARTFCKWHRMVFPDGPHPSLVEASRLMAGYSNRDLEQIQRIARMESDQVVSESLGKQCWTASYEEVWKEWVDRKGPDICIVFSEHDMDRC